MEAQQVYQIQMNEYYFENLMNMNPNILRITFLNLVEDFPRTFQNGTTIQTFICLIFMINICEIEYRHFGNIDSSKLMLDNFLINLRDYILEAQNEEAPYLLGENALNYDELLLAIEYGFNTISHYNETDYTLLIEEITEINNRYF